MLVNSSANSATVLPPAIIRRGWTARMFATMLIVLPLANASAQSEESESPPPLPPEIEAAASEYQACVNAVMSTLEYSAVKRAGIAETCEDERASLIAAFPEDLRPLIDTNTERRIQAVLDALEDIENVVIESSTDVNEISAELDALEEPTTGQD